MIRAFGQRVALAGRAGGEQELAHRGGQAEAHGGDVAADELHRVVDRHAGRDRPAGAVDVQPDVLLVVVALEVEELGADLVGDVVVDRRAEHDHPVPQQAVEDVGAGIDPGVEHVGQDDLGHGARLSAGREPGRRRSIGVRRAGLASIPYSDGTGYSDGRYRGDAGEDDGHALAGRGGALRGEQAGEARRCRSPRPGCPWRRRARGPRRSPSPARRSPGRRSGARRRARRASRRSRRRGCRRPPSAGRPTASSARPSGRRDRRRPRPPASARASGAQPSVCTASSRTPSPSPQPVHAANAPPPTCTTTRSRSTPASASSQPIVRPPSRHSAFSGPCTLNGTAPAATASRNRSTAGSPGGSAARRSHGWMRRAERLQHAEHGRRRPRRDEHVDRPRRPLGERRRGDRRVAARGDGQRPALPRRQPQRLGRHEVQQDRHEVAALVAAADVAGLVLHPDVGAERRRRATTSGRTA